MLRAEYLSGVGRPRRFLRIEGGGAYLDNRVIIIIVVALVVVIHRDPRIQAIGFP